MWHTHALRGLIRPIPVRVPARDDSSLIIAARALRTFGYGCTSVLLMGMLENAGISGTRLGLILAVAAAGCVLATIAMGKYADCFGRRTSLLVSACLMGIAGLAFAVTRSYPVLLIAAFIGTVSPSTNDNTPFSGVEQAILAQRTPARQHTAIFTRYNVTAQAAGAVGGLAAAALGALPTSLAGDAAFALYSIIAFTTGFLFLRLSAAAEPSAGPPAGSPTNAALPSVDPEALAAHTPTRLPGPVRRLACLFAVDAFAGGLAVQAILAWWFHHRYGATATDLGLIFFAANLLPAAAQLAAPLIVSRHGLLPAMLVPHLASNIFLACIPLAPDLGDAVVLLLARQALSKIDVPARQAFTAALVGPEHRTAAASLTTAARGVAVSVSPLAATLLLTGSSVALGGPLLVGAALAAAYDLAMWRSFRAKS